MSFANIEWRMGNLKKRDRQASAAMLSLGTVFASIAVTAASQGQLLLGAVCAIVAVAAIALREAIEG